MSESNDSRIIARDCIRKANSSNDNHDRGTWLFLAQSWALLADAQKIAENSADKSAA